MSGKGDGRRNEDRSAVERNWPFPDPPRRHGRITGARTEYLAQANAVAAERFDDALLEVLTGESACSPP